MFNRSKKRSSANAKNSSKIHLARNSISFHPTPFAKKIIFITIILASILVIVTVIFSSYFTNEHLVKSKINSLANEYYENFFYNNSISNIPENERESALGRYLESGFSTITLNHLLLYDDQKNKEYSDYLLGYCDGNLTYIKFYPLSPFNKTSYRAEFTYSCDF